MRPKPRRLRARETGVVVVTIGHLGFYGQTAGLDNGYSSAEVSSQPAHRRFLLALRAVAQLSISHLNAGRMHKVSKLGPQ